MQTAPAEALLTEVRPALIARIGAADLVNLFPVPFLDLDALAAAEPSRGTLLRLRTGRMVVIEYGDVTGRLTVSVPTHESIAETLLDLLSEAPIDSDAIEWLTDDIEPPAGTFASDDAELHALELRRTIQKKRPADPGEDTQTKLRLPKRD